MEILQLKYFQVVAKLENMTRAAEELRIAQPSLSKTITRLEESLGVPLFERQGRRIRLNQFGKIFLKRVEKSFKELDEGKREVADLAGLEGGSVTVGATASQQLPHIFREYLKLHPNVKFRFLQAAQHQEMQERLSNGEMDLCISTLPVDLSGIHCEPLTTVEIYLVVPPNHRLASRKSVQLQEMRDEPFINQTTEYGLREVTNEFCKQAGFVPHIANIAYEGTTFDVICDFVKEGFGSAFIPALWWDTMNTDSLVKLHIENPACQRTIWLSWVDGHYMSQAARNFRKYLIDYFSRTKEAAAPADRG